MVKVNKTYSIDLSTAQMIEHYVNDSVDAGLVSRSKLVNDAVRWWLSGEVNVAALVYDRERLVARIREHNLKLDSMESKKTDLPWWRRLLLGR